MESNFDRTKRSRGRKKIILSLVAVLILIPMAVSVVLVVRAKQLQKQVEELTAQLEAEQAETDTVTGIFTTASVEESARELHGPVQLENAEEASSFFERKIYLTFDDGPSSNTNEILDILQEYDVKATFFVVGKTDQQSIEAYQRIVEEGHTLAMHSYSHKYAELYKSRESFIQDLEQLQEYLYQITGVWPRYYRFPGGSSNTVSRVNMKELTEYLDQVGITYFDWNIESGDAVNGQLPAETIKNNCLTKIQYFSDCVILMHDASEKDTTVEALSRIIEGIQERGDSVFLPITEETVPIQHVMTN